MRRTAIIAALLIAALASPAAAQDAAGGTWLVKGRIGSFGFSLTCKFDQSGQTLGGACYDGGTNKAHLLTAGSAADGRISWTYKSSFMLHGFDAVYAGALEGGQIRGTVVAPGYSGVFTAARP